MEDEMKAVGVVALAGAALGAGLALGFGLRVLTIGAVVGLGPAWPWDCWPAAGQKRSVPTLSACSAEPRIVNTRFSDGA